MIGFQRFLIGAYDNQLNKIPMVIKFKDLTGRYSFVFKSDIDEAMNGGKSDPPFVYRRDRGNTAVYYDRNKGGESQLKKDIPDDAEVIEISV